MSRTVPSNLDTHVAGNVTTLALCLESVRSDGVSTYHTVHDEDIVYDGNTYLAGATFERTDIKTSSDFKTDDMEVVGILGGLDKFQVDIRAGLYDQAELYLFFINYGQVSDGIIKAARGRLGNITIGDGNYKAEVRSLHQLFNRRILRHFTPTCAVDLGSTKCGVNLAAFTFGANAVATFKNRSVMGMLPTSPPQTNFDVASYFNGGKVVWTSGDNNGFTNEVRLHEAAATPNITVEPTVFLTQNSQRSANTLTIRVESAAKELLVGDVLIVAVYNQGATNTIWSTVENEEFYEIANYQANGGHISVAYHTVTRNESWAFGELTGPFTLPTTTCIIEGGDVGAAVWRLTGALDPSAITIDSVTYDGSAMVNHDPPDLVTTTALEQYFYLALDSNVETQTYSAYPSGTDDSGAIPVLSSAGSPTGAYGAYANKVDTAVSYNFDIFSVVGDTTGYMGIVLAFPAAAIPTIEFLVPTAYEWANGDTFDITRGCDKSLPVCENIFSNGVNHRGFPHVPGRKVLEKTFENQ